MGERGCPNDRHLLALLEGALGQARQSEAERHIDRCRTCQQRLELIADPDSLRPSSPCPETVKESTRSKWLGAVIDSLRRSTAHGTSPTSPSRIPTKPDRADLLQPPRRPGAIGRLGPYDVMGAVGRGGMGVVYRAIDTLLDRTVALKLIRPDWAINKDARQRFMREAKMTAAIDHENVITIHAVQQFDGVPCLVMQFVAGESLADRLVRCGRLDVHQVISLARQLAAGLAAAHAQGMVHRDIKPANVLFEKDTGRVKITDFGLAKVVDDASLTRTGMLTGTPETMSPEQAQGSRVDHRSDLFSVGVVLYSALAGQSPFRSDSLLATLKGICSETPPALEDVRPEVPPWLARLVERLMHKDPEARFQSALEVAQVVEAQRAMPPSPPRPSEDLSATARRKDGARKRRRPLFVVGSGAMALSLLLFVAEMTGWTNFVGRKQAVTQGFHLLDKGRVFQTLADAVTAAESGDVIEVYASGNVSTTPVRITGKVLTIRAGQGQRPVFTIQGDRRTAAPLITSDAPIVLEGLEFDWQGGRGSVGSPEAEPSVVRLEGGSLWVANCRIVVGREMACLEVRGAAGQVRNSELIAEGGTCLVWNPPAEAQIELHHCVLGGRAALTVMPPASNNAAASARIRLIRNTITAEKGIQFAVTRGSKGRTTVTVERNVFDVSYLCMLSGARGYGWLPRDMPSGDAAQRLLKRIVQWRERDNVYSASTNFLAFGLAARPTRVELAEPRKLADWLAYWGRTDAGSTTVNLSRRSPKDVGADTRFVGVGMAYQRWKRTDEYRHWHARIRAIPK